MCVASAQETALTLPSPGDTAGAFSLGSVLARMDIFILGMLIGIEIMMMVAVLLNLCARLCIVLAKYLH